MSKLFGRRGRWELWQLVLVWMMCNVRGSSAWGWLMVGKWNSTNFALPCNATYCVNLPDADASMPFHLHRCVGVRFWGEQFSYDGVKFAMSTPEGVEFCLDVVGSGTVVGLRTCNSTLASQRWEFRGTKLQNGQGLFLMAPAPLVPYAASSLALIVGELNEIALSDWTFVDSAHIGMFKPALPSARSSNLVVNDQFLENWGEIEAEGSPGDMTLLCGWTILGHSKTTLIRNTVSNRSVGWDVGLGAISQIVPTHLGLPHALKFNVRLNGTCAGGDSVLKKLLVSLTPSSSESNVFDVDSNGGLWRAEEIRFVAKDSTVNLTFASSNDDSGCSLVIGNVELGLEDDYLIFESADKLQKRLGYLYALVAFVGTVTLAVSVAYALWTLRSRKLEEKQR